jgi:ribosomal protein S18 acetylase RimI-like enzyme
MTETPTHIRSATADDHDWIVAQHGAVYAAEFGFDASFQDNIARKIPAFVQPENAFNRIWIAEVGGARAASIAISERPGKSGFLNFVLVLPAYRGRGLARTMMDTALDHARSHGMTEVSLETYDCLVDAREIYRRYGFAITEVTPGMAAFGQTFDREFWAMRL